MSYDTLTLACFHTNIVKQDEFCLIAKKEISITLFVDRRKRCGRHAEDYRMERVRQPMKRLNGTFQYTFPIQRGVLLIVFGEENMKFSSLPRFALYPDFTTMGVQNRLNQTEAESQPFG